MKISLLKKTVVLMLLAMMIALAGIAMAESVETTTENKDAVINGTAGPLTAYPADFNVEPGKSFKEKYLGSLTNDELNAKYEFELVADDCFYVYRNNLLFGASRVPMVNIQVVSADAEGKSVKIIMSSKETGEQLHVMEYKYTLKGERQLDITCSGDYEHEFIDGLGEVLTVPEGSDLTIRVAHTGVNETLSYDWLDSNTDELLLSGTDTFSLTDISESACLICVAKTAEGELEAIFFNVEVAAAEPEEPEAPTSATYTQTVMLGSPLFNGVSSAMDSGAVAVVMKDFDNDGTITIDELKANVTVDVQAGKGISNVKVSDFSVYTYDDGETSISAPHIHFDVSEEADGETLTVTVSNKDGETFTTYYVIELMDVVRKTPAVDAASGAVLADGTVGDDDYDLTVEEGATVTVTLNYENRTGGAAQITSEWQFYDKDNGKHLGEAVTNQTGIYTFTATQELNGKILEVYSYKPEDRETYDNIWFAVKVTEKAEPEKPVWKGFTATSAGEYELVEGETTVLRAEMGKQVTVTANYEYTGSASKQIYWNFNNGEGWKSLESKTNTCTFTLTEEGRLGFTLNDNGPVIDEVLFVEELVPETTAEVTTQSVEAIINGTAGPLTAYPANLNTASGKAFKEKYLGSLSNDELNAKYEFELVADDCFSVYKNDLLFGASYVPKANIQVVSKDAEGKSVKIIMFSKETGAALHVMEYVYTLKGERQLDITCSDTYEHEFIDGLGEVLRVYEGSDLTISVAHKGIGEALNVSYEWIDEATENVIAKAGTLTLQDITEDRSLVCVALTASDELEAIFFHIEVVEKPAGTPTPTPTPTATPTAPAATPVPTTKVEYTEGIPQEAITEELEKNITEELVKEGFTEEEIAEKGIAAVIEEKMETTIVVKAAETFKDETTGEPVEIPEEQTAVYEVTLMFTSDGGKTWEKADEEHWPESGKLDVVLPYPAGTNMNTTKFVVAHMFTQTTADHKAGEVEYPVVTNKPDGIHFQVSGLSPIALAWTYEPQYKPYLTTYGQGIPESAVTADMKLNGLQSAEMVEVKLTNELNARLLSAGKQDALSQIAICDVVLRRSMDGGSSWENISMKDWNSKTVEITLPYPKGTSKNTHDFIVAHMFANGAKAGQIEYLDYVAKDDGLHVKVTSMSPFAVAAIQKPAAVPSTGDSAMPMLWLLGMLIAGIGCAAMLNKRRQNG